MKPHKPLVTLAIQTVCAALVLLTTAHAAIIVSAGSGVYRYGTDGVLQHTYATGLGGYQGVAFDFATNNVYFAYSDFNGPLVQYTFNGVTENKVIMSATYAAVAAKSTIGIVFNNGLIVANPYFFGPAVAETTGFNPLDPTDTIPVATSRFVSNGATGITASAVAGRYFMTDFNGSVVRLNNFGIGLTPTSTTISASNLGGGIRGLALSADESTLWVADQAGNKVISLNIATGVSTDFITTVAGATDVLRDGNNLYVSTTTGVDLYDLTGTLITNNLISLTGARYLTTAIPEPSSMALVVASGLAILVGLRRRSQLRRS